MENRHGCNELPRLRVQAFRRSRRLLDQCRILLRHLIELRDRIAHLSDALGLLMRRGADLADDETRSVVDEDAAPDLVRLVHQSQSPVGRLHALWTLDGLDKLETPEIEAGLADKEAGVRENAIILAEPRHEPKVH